MGHLAPGDIAIHQKGSDSPRFSTLEERRKEDTRREILILGQYKSLESGDDLLTVTDVPSQIPTNLEEVEKDAVGAEITREVMAKMWST